MKFFIFCLILLVALTVSPSMAEAPSPMLAGGEDQRAVVDDPDSSTYAGRHGTRQDIRNESPGGNAYTLDTRRLCDQL